MIEQTFHKTRIDGDQKCAKEFYKNSTKIKDSNKKKYHFKETAIAPPAKFYVISCKFVHFSCLYAPLLQLSKCCEKKHTCLQTNRRVNLARSKDISFFAIVVHFLHKCRESWKWVNHRKAIFEHSIFSQKDLKLKGSLEQAQTGVCETLTAVSLLRSRI